MTTPLTAEDAGDILHDYACEPEAMEGVGAQLAAIRDGVHVVVARMTEVQAREAFYQWWKDNDHPGLTSSDTWLAALRAAGILKGDKT